MCQQSLESCGVEVNDNECTSICLIDKGKELCKIFVFCSLHYAAVEGNKIIEVNANDTANEECISDVLRTDMP